VRQFQNDNGFLNLVALPFGSPVAVAAGDFIENHLGVRLCKVVFHFVHPEAVTVLKVYPSRLVAYIDYDEVHGTDAK